MKNTDKNIDFYAIYAIILNKKVIFMDYFSFRLGSEKRLTHLVPPLLSIGYSNQDPPAFRALKRDTVNIGVILSANFRQASYEMDGYCYFAPIPAVVCITPGRFFRQCNPGSCEKLFFSYSRTELRYFTFFLEKPENFIMHFELSSRVKEVLNGIFRLCREIRLPGNADRLDFLCAELLYEIILNASLPQNVTDSPQKQAIYHIASHFDLHFTEKINFDELARSYGMSLRTFLRIWQKQFHMSPRAYLLLKQLDEARRLLVETELKIYEVAEQVGFSDPFYFSRFFKIKTGFSPKAYRLIKWRYSSRC